MIRALIAVCVCATAYCGVKGAPQPPENPAAKDRPALDAGPIPSGAIAPDATANPSADLLDAGCVDAGPGSVDAGAR